MTSATRAPQTRENYSDSVSDEDCSFQDRHDREPRRAIIYGIATAVIAGGAALMGADYLARINEFPDTIRIAMDGLATSGGAGVGGLVGLIGAALTRRMYIG